MYILAVLLQQHAREVSLHIDNSTREKFNQNNFFFFFFSNNRVVFLLLASSHFFFLFRGNSRCGIATSMHRNFVRYSFSVAEHNNLRQRRNFRRSCASIIQRLDQPRRRRTLTFFFFFSVPKIFLREGSLCMCVACTRKGNLTHRRQPSRLSFWRVNFACSCQCYFYILARRCEEQTKFILIRFSWRWKLLFIKYLLNFLYL